MAKGAYLMAEQEQNPTRFSKLRPLAAFFVIVVVIFVLMNGLRFMDEFFKAPVDEWIALPGGVLQRTC